MKFDGVSNLTDDIYYQRDYAKLYEGESECFNYLYKEGALYVSFSSLKRRIKSVAGVYVDEELYDLETPYGYGGPLSNSRDEKFFKRAFSEYKNFCSEKKIVCEFVRLHPFNQMSRHAGLFDMHSFERQIVVVNLEGEAEDRRKEYSKTTRNILKKAQKNLIVEQNHSNLKNFMDLYYETMEKNDADNFFYFDSDYFKRLSCIDEVSLLSVKKGDEYVSLGFFVYSKELAHYHLSANSQRYVKENGNYLLLDAAFDQAKSHGCRYMMLGGGRTSSPDDGLFKFKSKFSNLRMPFYIAGIDFLPGKREILNKIWLKEKSQKVVPNLFQLYRA